MARCTKIYVALKSLENIVLSLAVIGLPPESDEILGPQRPVYPPLVLVPRAAAPVEDLVAHVVVDVGHKGF